MSSIYSNDLEKFNEVYGNAQEASDEYESVPDGKYQVMVDRVELKDSQAGNTMLVWTLKILGPKFAGRLLWKNSVFTEKSIPYVKKDLSVCQLHLSKLSDLPDSLDRLLDLKLNVNKRTKDEFDQIYFESLITSSNKSGISVDAAKSHSSFEDDFPIF